MQSEPDPDDKIVRLDESSARPARLSVLVVDDDTMARFGCRMLLEDAGHRVTDARDALEALALLSSHCFDLIIMDIRMPEMDGLEATRRIKADGLSAAPVIGLTATLVSEERERYLATGMEEVLAKPLELAELEAVARRVIDKGPARP